MSHFDIYEAPGHGAVAIPYEGTNTTREDYWELLSPGQIYIGEGTKHVPVTHYKPLRLSVLRENGFEYTNQFRSLEEAETALVDSRVAGEVWLRRVRISNVTTASNVRRIK